MSPDRHSKPVVRVELAELDEGETSDVPQPPSGGSLSAVSVIAVAASITAVIVLVVAFRPQAGRSADGAPITIPTTAVPDTTIPPETEPPVEQGEDVTGSAAIELDRAELPGFLIDLVETDSGWLGLVAAQSGSTRLWRSSDGLDWSELPDDGLPTGDIIGVNFINGEYLIAIDTLSSHSLQRLSLQQQFPDHDVQAYRSDDAEVWIRDLDFAKVAGNGFPLFAQFSEDALLVPMIGASVTEIDDELIELLGEFMPDAVAVEVCRAVRRPEDGGTAIVFLDCAGEELWVIARGTLPEKDDELFGEARIELCIDAARNDSREREYYHYVQRREPIVQFDAPEHSALNGPLIAGGVVMVSNPPFVRVSCPDGLPLPGSPRADIDVLRWTRSEGTVLMATLPNEFGFFGEVVALDDGSIRTATFSQVLEASAPYTDWEVIFEQEGIPGSLVSLAPDGSMFMTETSRGSLMFGTGDGEPFEVDVGRRIEFARLVIVERDYAIVSTFNGSGTNEFFKVPFG